jgi:hypothetical protein
MIRETTRPISAAERAQQEPAIIVPRDRDAILRLIGIAGFGVPGMGLVALGTALIWHRSLLPSPLAVIILASITALIGAAMLVRALWHLRVLVYPGNDVVRKARVLSNAMVREVQVNVAAAWWSEVDIDILWLMLRDVDGKYVSISTDRIGTLIANVGSGDVSLRVGRQTTLVVHEREILDIVCAGEHVEAMSVVAESKVAGLACRTEVEIEIFDEDKLSKAMRRELGGRVED